MKKVLSLALLLIMAAVMACAGSPPMSEVSSAASQPQKASAVSDSAYQLGCSDIIEVQVWKEPELTRTVVVTADGQISLPLLGQIQAEGLTCDQLAKDVAGKYKEYVENPVVSVMVLQPNSSRFYVMGQVLRPGEYALSRGTTVLQAISTAGGFTEWADKGAIVLLRRNGENESRFKCSYKRIVSGSSPEENYLLQPGDTVIVP